MKKDGVRQYGISSCYPTLPAPETFRRAPSILECTIRSLVNVIQSHPYGLTHLKTANMAASGYETIRVGAH